MKDSKAFEIYIVSSYHHNNYNNLTHLFGFFRTIVKTEDIMIKIKGLSVDRKLMGAFALIGILLIIVSVISISTLNSLDSRAKDLIGNEISMEKKALQINVSMLEARRSEKDFLMRLDVSYVDKVTIATAEVRKNAEDIKKLDVPQERKDMADRIIVLAGEYDKSFLEVVQLYKTKGLDENSGIQDELRTSVHAVEDDINKQKDSLLLADMLQLRRNEKDFLLRGDVAYQKTLHDNEKKLVDDLAASSVPQNVKDDINYKLKTYTADFDKLVVITGQIAEKTNEFRDVVHQIEPIISEFGTDAETDMAAKTAQTDINNSNAKTVVIILSIITVVSGIAIGIAISRTLRNFVGNVQNAVFKVASTAEELSASSEEMRASTDQISTSAQSIATGVGQQSFKMADISRTMKEMSMSVQQVAGNATKAAEGADNAHVTAQQVGEKSQEVVRQMTEIRTAVDNSAIVIRQLDTKSQQIGEFIGVITNIADQTNLLALNAAIEAARAGEHGRGFAVVADEVRKLAEGSRNAASEITVLVKEIQKGTKDAVGSMEQGTIKVNEGTKTIEDTVSSVNGVVRSAKDVAAMVQEIAAAAEQQAASVEEVTTSVEEVSSISEESASGTEETSSAAEEQAAAMEQLTTSAQELAKLAMELQIEVSKFNNVETESPVSKKGNKDQGKIPQGTESKSIPKEKGSMNRVENISLPSSGDRRL